jgi:carboxyl-terminal processing protease
LKKFAKIPKIFLLIIFALFFYFLGYLVGHENLVFEKNYKPVIVNKELLKPRTVDFGIFWDAWNKVTANYVGTVDYQKMVYGAVKGMVDSLGDPYSVFMEPSETQSFMEDLSGQVSGIGAELDVVDNQLTVISPIIGSPAEKAGLKPQDQILKINNESTDGMSLDTAVSKIRGKAGTKVTLTINRSGFESPQTLEITRENIQIKSVNWEIKSDNVAYIQISQFGDDTSDLMQQAAKEINDKHPKAIILDLRNNPGGYLDKAVDVASLFMPSGVVVQEKDKNGNITEEKTTLEPILQSYKVIVLVNGGSASASEIVAGALQDAGRATLVGEKTFGKGSVQDLENLAGGATLKITVAKWLTPKGRTIDKVGLEPDVTITLTEDDTKAGRDPQLDKALQMTNQ